MRAIILSLLLSLSVNAQTIWYVDRDATGANTGRNWADAWTSLDSIDTYWGEGTSGINWNVINAGDTIYVSGGNDSTVYSPRTNYPHNQPYGLTMGGGVNRSFASGAQVVIAPAWHPGHNGDVYFTIYGNEDQILQVKNLSNIKLTGFNFFNGDSRTSIGGMIVLGGWEGIIGNDSLITIDNCHIVSNGIGGMIALMGTANTISNCKIEHLPNSLPNDMDMVGVNSGAGGHTITGNTMIYRNSCDTTDAHRDCIQFSNFGLPGERRTTTISNNLIMIDEPSGNHWNTMIYWYGQTDNNADLLIYNNIFVNSGTQTPGALHIGRFIDNYHFGLKVLNNTFFIKNAGFHTNWQLDTMVFKNNLIILDTIATYFYNAGNTPTEWNNYAKEIDFNYYAKLGGQGVNNLFSYGGQVSYTWNQWRAQSGIDANSFIGNSSDVTFTNPYDTSKASYYTTTGRDLGVDLSSEFPFLQYDILGNPRTGSWDMGALEYQGTQSNNIEVKSKIFLQGPFNTNSMNTNLSQNSLLPNTQPFNAAPWNYNGSESLGSGSGSSSSYVDWVLVELRNSSNPTQVVSRRAAILKNDGTLLNNDGSIGVPFSNVQEGSYYVAVFHKNHLAVMSAAPVQLTANSQLYDFTNGMNKAFGTNPMANLGNGIFGMYAGDGNSNGGITITDRNEVWLPQNGTLGYLNGDFNLDGGVTIHDINLYWNINNGIMTQVP